MTVDSPQPTVQRLLDPTTPSSEGVPANFEPYQAVRRPGNAKARILATASRLFYRESIRGVGVDRLIEEAGVTKATFYKHYGSKDNLIVTYVRARHDEAERGMTALRTAATTPADALHRWVDAVTDAVNSDGFHGCPFLNAAAEFHDHNHPVRAIVLSHRDWYTDQLADMLRSIDCPLPGDGADDLMLARDGAMSGAYAGDPVASTASLRRVARRLLIAA